MNAARLATMTDTEVDALKRGTTTSHDWAVRLGSLAKAQALKRELDELEREMERRNAARG